MTRWFVAVAVVALVLILGGMVANSQGPVMPAGEEQP